MSYDDAVDLTGVTDKEKLHAGWLKSLGQDGKPHDQDEADNYTGEQNDLANGGYSAKKCLIVEIRWFEKQTYYRGPDIENPQQAKEYDERQFKLLNKQDPNFPGVRQQRPAFVHHLRLGQRSPRHARRGRMMLGTQT